MPESYGITLSTATVNKQLIARSTPLATRGILLTGGVPYLAGAIVFAPTIAGPFAKSVTASMPTDASVVAIVSQDIDLTALGNTQHIGYVGPGEFIKGTVFAASGVMDAASLLAIEAALLKRGMNLVRSAYDDVTGSV